MDVFNAQYNVNTKFNPRVVKPSLSSSWLSGFIDAEGSFQARVKACRTSRLRKSPHLTLSISQKELNILTSIRELFLGETNKNLRYDKSWGGWELHISSIKKLKEVIIYLNAHPLKTKKLIAFQRWCEIYQLIKDKEHLTESGLKRIAELSLRINKGL